MIDFPNAPANGASFTAAGITYKFDAANNAWRGQQPPGGGLMDAPADGKVYARKSAAWSVLDLAALGIPNHNLLTIANDGSNVGGTLAATAATNGSSSFVLTKKGTGAALLYGNDGALTRWSISLADPNGNFGVSRYNDAGAFLDSPLFINRTSGNAFFSKGVYFGGSANYSMYQQGNLSVLAYTGTYYWQWDAANGHLQYVRGGNVSLRIRSTGDIDTYAPAMTFGADATTIINNAGNARYFQWYAGYRWQLNMDTGIVYLITNEGQKGEWRLDGTYVIGGQGFKPGGGPWADTSDRRIKDNITDYASGLDAVLALRPVTYNFKPETGRDTSILYHGLIAQEAEVSMPEMVTAKADKVGELEFDDLRTLDSTPLVYALVNAVKQLHARNEALEATVLDLMDRMLVLEGKA